MSVRQSIATLLTLALSLPVYAASKRQAEVREVNPMALIMSVVKITNTSADLFSADQESSHGTGFFVGIDKESGKGVIFTNKHVIDTTDLDAQDLTVEFNTAQRRAEGIDAKLVYVSRLHDFAVLEFDPKDLKRADLSEPLRLPTKDSPFYDFIANERSLRGLGVMAIGNPFDGSNVTTYGQITALYNDEMKGPFIQTQTPINPGNSGGPLISLDTAEVVGINTLTYSGADGTHYSIPIGILVDEYKLWRQQVKKNDRYTIAEPRTINATVASISEQELKLLNLRDPIGRAIKGYWDNHSAALIVSDAPKGSVLKNLDIVLTVNGRPIGGHYYDLSLNLRDAQGDVEVMVLRNGKTLNLKVPVRVDAYTSRREKVDYVYISGLLLQQMPKRSVRLLRPDLADHYVGVSDLIDSPDLNFNPGMFPPKLSVLTTVHLGGKEYPIRRLVDLKLALKENPNETAITMRFYRANYVHFGQGRIAPAASSTGMPLLDGTTTVIVLPLREVLTPSQFSLHKFKKQFGFGVEQADTRDWRGFLKTTCEKRLAAQGKE